MTVSHSGYRVSNYLAADAAAHALRRDVRDGLTATPKSLPPKWFYDAVGSDLFDQITRLPEYYPTRAEARDPAGPRRRHRRGIGSGHAGGTRQRHLREDPHPARRAERTRIAAPLRPVRRRRDGARVGGRRDRGRVPRASRSTPCVGDFEEHLGKIPAVGRRLVVFLGSTIGNLTAGPRAEFLRDLADTMQPGDGLLLGTDLVKDVGRLVRAYDDAAGVTAAFNKNVLAVVNRELGADFDLEAFDHVARWNPEDERIEMWLRAGGPQRVRIDDLELTVDFADGEEMLTEVSCKFRPDGIADELAAAGLRTVQWWTDDAGDFGLSLAVK